MEITKHFEYFKSTEPINRPQVEKLIKQAYKLTGHCSDPVFIWVRGPREANIVNDMIEKLPVNKYKQAPTLAKNVLAKKTKPKKWHYNFGGGGLGAGVFAGQEEYFDKKPEEYEKMAKTKDGLEIYNTFSAIGREASLWWQWERVVVCAERPIKMDVELLSDNKIRHHCETGPVIAWGDGYCMYFLNDVRVPEWLVNTAAEDLTIDQYLKEKNLEIRREIGRKIGWPRLFKHFKATLIDEWQPTLDEVEYAHMPGVPVAPYKLYQVTVPLPNNDERKALALKMELTDKDGLCSTYVELTKNTDCKSAREAFFSMREGVPNDVKIILS